MRLDDPDSTYSKANIISIFGHDLNDDPVMLEDCKKFVRPQQTAWGHWRRWFYLIPYLIFPNYFMRKYEKEYHSSTLLPFKMKSKPSNEIYNFLCGSFDGYLKVCFSLGDEFHREQLV